MFLTCIKSKQNKKELEEEIINIVKLPIIDKICNFIVEKDTRYTYYLRSRSHEELTHYFIITTNLNHKKYIKYTNNLVELLLLEDWEYLIDEALKSKQPSRKYDNFTGTPFPYNYRLSIY